jgi:hypothetical protein
MGISVLLLSEAFLEIGEHEMASQFSEIHGTRIATRKKKKKKKRSVKILLNVCSFLSISRQIHL